MSDRPALARSCILVADDLEANQELVRIYLRVGGYQAAFVANGVEAVRAVQSKIYDLVLMDVQMPQMDGIAAAKAIRKLDGSVRNIPIIAMTANVLPKQIRSIEAAGINGYVTKPTELEDLLTEIGRLVRAPKVLDHSIVPAERAPLITKDFREFREISGKEVVTAWLSRLSEELRTTFSDQEPDMIDRSQLARRAHAIVSQAGILGFSDLARLCGTLEEACANGGDVSSPFRKAELAARAAREAIGSLVEQP
jgi:CheY-like chemotaxis protein/HPt (histidine-containing phosphotransfer) domain-containing protein